MINQQKNSLELGLTHREHLQQLMEQQKTLLQEVQSLNEIASTKRDVALKLQGAIEYIQQIGVTLSEPEVTIDET